MSLLIANLNCLTNQLLVDFAHSAEPLLPVHNMSPLKKKKKNRERRKRKKEGKNVIHA